MSEHKYHTIDTDTDTHQPTAEDIRYEKAYKVFDAERRSEREKKDAARYISVRSKKVFRDKLNNQKLGKKV